MSIQQTHYPLLFCRSDGQEKRYWHFFMDLKYLLESKSVKQGGFRKVASNLAKTVDVVVLVWIK